ncbi:MAG TPA: VanZ family protein [Vicinamibacterales bacterium]|nr:VanZ family protein [Vicinamibacterales bacterium]
MLRPIIASCAIVLCAPFMGQIRAALQAALPSGTYRAVVGAAVIGSIIAALAVGVVRIRERRGVRYGALLVALVIGLAYARFTASGNPGVDLVERVHFVEYGVLALLFFRACRHREDRSLLAIPVFASVVVAFFDEWLQWFVPGRVGEIRDVALDAVAIGCGLLFAVGLDLPSRLAQRLRTRASVGAGVSAGVAILTAALFVDVIHLGHEVQLGHSTLRSRYTSRELESLSHDRTERWRSEGPPMTLRRVSREDQYLAEGLWHVQRRNEAAGAGDALMAWRENEILERFFSPILDWPTYAAPMPSRWPPAQREDFSSRSAADERPYVSTAQAFPLFTLTRPTFWTFVAVALGAVGWWCVRRPRAALARPEVTAL